MEIEKQIQEHLTKVKTNLDQIVGNYETQLTYIQTGHTTIKVFHNIIIDYYGTLTPLLQAAVVNSSGANYFTIRPYETAIKKNILVALHKSNLDIVVTEDKTTIHVQFEKLSGEIRLKRVKDLKTVHENFKIQVRNERRNFIQHLKKIPDISRNMIELYEGTIEKIIDRFMEKLESLTVEKQKLLLQI